MGKKETGGTGQTTSRTGKKRIIKDDPPSSGKEQGKSCKWWAENRKENCHPMPARAVDDHHVTTLRWQNRTFERRKKQSKPEPAAHGGRRKCKRTLELSRGHRILHLASAVYVVGVPSPSRIIVRSIDRSEDIVMVVGVRSCRGGNRRQGHMYAGDHGVDN